MFAINAIDTHEAWMRKAYFTFRQRLLSSTNNIITRINTNTWSRHNYMWQKLDNSLYICHNYCMFHIILTNVCSTVIWYAILYCNLGFVVLSMYESTHYGCLT
jgi:hypothetical protein